ncbi:TPM domain-containing protein [Acinetobacter wuhouensis]|uniref:TPM domain-containing protein n=1 Tax=Acinetobacter wuhouensis TaxID=1879050 RepID=A0A3G2T7E5_9GAMM|nr:TPM domain-containing protein [Acinetobacter wuhouensis]AYO55457.1 hypothetical protein CDG68_18155 [Acinetobacter wuhouensis]
MLLFNKKIYLTFILFTLTLFISVISHALSPELLQQLKKENVVDTTQTLSDNQIAEIKSQNEYLYQEKKIDLKILMVPSTEGASIEQYAEKVFNTIKIGNKKLNNGLLLVIAKDDRKMRFEVGYGLEGEVTDIQAGRIIRHILAPNFKNNDYYYGIIAAQQSISQLSEGFVITDNGGYRDNQLEHAIFIFKTSVKLLFGILIVWLWFYAFNNTAGSRDARQGVAFFVTLFFSLFWTIFLNVIFDLGFWSFIGLSFLSAFFSASIFPKYHQHPRFNRIVLISLTVIFSITFIYLIFCYLFKSQKGAVSEDFSNILSFALSFVPTILMVVVGMFISNKLFSNKKEDPKRLPDPFPNTSPSSNTTDRSSSNRSSSSNSSSHSSSSSSSSNDRDSGGSSGGGGASGSW